MCFLLVKYKNYKYKYVIALIPGLFPGTFLPTVYFSENNFYKIGFVFVIFGCLIEFLNDLV